MTHKEFYFWLDGFMSNKDWTVFKQTDIETIKEKMGQVKDETRFGIAEPYRVPIPVNPFPIQDNPYKPPYEIYCGNKNKLDD